MAVGFGAGSVGAGLAGVSAGVSGCGVVVLLLSCICFRSSVVFEKVTIISINSTIAIGIITFILDLLGLVIQRL